MKKLFLAAAISAVLLPSAAFAGSYTSENLQAQFDTPNGWSVSEVGGGMADPYVSLLPVSDEAKKRGVGGAFFTDNGMWEDIPTDYSQLSQYFHSTMASKAPKDYTFVSESETFFAGYPARLFVFTSRYDTVPELSRHYEIYFMRGNFLGIAQFSAPDAEFDRYWQEAQGAFNSFRFTS